MNSHDIEAMIEFHKHELADDTPREVAFSHFCENVAHRLGVEDLDGSDDVNGFSIDHAWDLFEDGVAVDEAVAQFEHEIARVSPQEVRHSRFILE